MRRLPSEASLVRPPPAIATPSLRQLTPAPDTDSCGRGAWYLVLRVIDHLYVNCMINIYVNISSHIAYCVLISTTRHPTCLQGSFTVDPMVTSMLWVSVTSGEAVLVVVVVVCAGCWPLLKLVKPWGSRLPSETTVTVAETVLLATLTSRAPYYSVAGTVTSAHLFSARQVYSPASYSSMSWMRRCCPLLDTDTRPLLPLG